MNDAGRHDEHEELSNKHKIHHVPTVFFVRKGKVVHKIVGCESSENLSKHPKKLLAG